MTPQHTHINPPPPSAYPAQTHVDEVARKVRWWGVWSVVVAGLVCVWWAGLWLAAQPTHVPASATDTTKTQMKSFKGPLQLFRQELGVFPSHPGQLVDGGYMPELPTDAWGNEFRLEVVDESTVKMASAGDDEQFDSDDDVILTLEF